MEKVQTVRVSAAALALGDPLASFPSPAHSPARTPSCPHRSRATAEGNAGEGMVVWAAGVGHTRVAGAPGPTARPSPGGGTILGGVDPAPTSNRALALLAAGGVALHLGPGPRPSTAMSGRSVPHAHPATAEYEFANPSRLGEQRFGEDEVTVRTVDNLLEVSARHPQRLDRHGFVSREFCRTYVLPADVDPWRVRAALSHDGILNLEAPRGGRHLDTEVNEVYISLLPAPPDLEEEEEAAKVEP
ncbi:heat shock protein beta-2 isoform X2 [Saccopteryx bilineata]|uniref:heat shock protein beta-2 isoform X2 n=1 Tax=Saccopteryx bilineata TaxID=59482 RepID=UPI00338F6E67